jgi:transcriptional regulator with XRE-family HTH domain
MGTPSTLEKKMSRELIAENVRLRLDVLYRKHQSDRQKVLALAADAGLGRNTIYRILEAKTGTSVDALDSLATALHCEPYELLLPSDR